MFLQDLIYIFGWWSTILLIGTLFLPINFRIFSNFFDKGYIFSKILGIIFSSYIIFLLGTAYLVPFSRITALLVISLMGLISYLTVFSIKNDSVVIKKDFFQLIRNKKRIFILEEILFLLGIVFWVFVRSHNPDIHDLEKFMDFGFINSILRTEYFPAKDMWFQGFSINYYYFGHLMTAVLTKVSGLGSNITFNLMLSTIFAFTLTCSFSIGINLLKDKVNKKMLFFGGFLIATLVAMAGNLHTIYSLFESYGNDNPKPLWQLALSLQDFPNSYWYPNATRFIYNTIHEFPLYSFVVADLHGHVLSIPIVLTLIAYLLNIFIEKEINIKFLVFYSFLLATAYMTNAWDGLIYLGTITLLLFFLILEKEKTIFQIAKRMAISLVTLLIGFYIFSLPFSIFFSPFAKGIGLICAPQFLIELKNIGPFLFESDRCIRSPLYQLLTLYGFFYFFAICFVIFLRKKIVDNSDLFILIIILASTFLIIFPEFIYLKDIYDGHFRANTMFKLVYQAFIMLSIAAGYMITKLLYDLSMVRKCIFLIPSIILLFFVFLYPYLAITSAYNGPYRGLDGTKYLGQSYPNDYQAIIWINENIKGQPVILEAQGDSYTDFARISATTGLPTVLGWTVHEWLWRGTYDIPAPRIGEIQSLYESTNTAQTKNLLEKYDINLVFIGDLERNKYKNINEEKFKSLGEVIYSKGSTQIYKIN